MSFILRFFTRSYVASNHASHLGVPARTHTPVRDLPNHQKGVVIELFRRFYSHHHPHPKCFEEQTYSTLKNTPYSFTLITRYFEANIEMWEQNPIAVHIENDLLTSLKMVSEGDETKAYEQLQLSIKKLKTHKIQENEINTLINAYKKNPKKIKHRFPELPPLLFEYQRARAIYDVAVKHWATSYLKTLPPTSNKKRSLKSRITSELKRAAPSWLAHLFGYKSVRFQMLELRERTLNALN